VQGYKEFEELEQGYYKVAEEDYLGSYSITGITDLEKEAAHVAETTNDAWEQAEVEDVNSYSIYDAAKTRNSGY
jgi:hypothetical protein